jgi:hypothetical protein
MGSCLAIPAGAYASVRGFPRKDAAEDFYALDKLAKVGAIQRISGNPLLLEGRPSDRVPFGTGRALRDLTGGKRSLAHFRLDHPLAYAHLAAWLRVLDRMADSKGEVDRALVELPSDNPFFRTDLLREALEKMQVAPAIAQAREKSGDPETMRRHLHTWFDAFRTRKLLHALRAGLPPLPWREALAEAPFTELSASTEDDVEELRAALSSEERKLAARRVGLPQNGKPIET